MEYQKLLRKAEAELLNKGLRPLAWVMNRVTLNEIEREFTELYSFKQFSEPANCSFIFGIPVKLDSSLPPGVVHVEETLEILKD